MPIDYGYLVSRAWQLTWRHRVLWALGLILALTSAGTSSGGGGDRGQVQYQAGAEFWQQYGALVIAGMLVLLLVGLVVSFLSAAAEGGLIAAAERMERSGEPLTFRAAWGLGWRKMLSIWVLRLVMGLLIAAAVLVTTLPLIVGAVGSIASGEGLAIALGGVAFCFALPLLVLGLIVFGLLREYAVRALVIENEGIFQSLGSGWRMLRSYAGPTIVVALIQLMISLVVALVIVGLVLPPAAAVGILAVFSGLEVTTGTIVLAVLAGLLLWAVTALLSAIPTAFGSVLWTETYMVLRGMVPARPSPAVPA